MAVYVENASGLTENTLLISYAIMQSGLSRSLFRFDAEILKSQQAGNSGRARATLGAASAARCGGGRGNVTPST